MADDIPNDGVRANSVLPGLASTGDIEPQSEGQKRGAWEQQAIKRLGDPL